MRSPRFTFVVAAFTSLVAAGSAAPIAAQASPDSGTLVLSQGGAEIVRERFLRRGDTLEGEMTTPAGQRASYTATLMQDGRIPRFEAREHGSANASAPSQIATVTVRGDSVHVQASASGTPASAAIATRAGALPYLNPSPALMGQIVRRARAIRGSTDRVEVPVFILGGGGQTVQAAVSLAGSDRATLTIGGVAAELVVDEAGNVISGSVPGQGISIERVR